MTVSYTSVFTPMAAELPPDTDVDAILVDLADNHVAAPKGKNQDELAAIVNDAREHGIPLSIVVVPGNPARESDLRDLATDVGKAEHGTVAVFSDSWVGTYSDTFTRARLEWAEDTAKYTGGQSAVAARIFVDHLETPEKLSWTAVTGVLLAGTVIAVGGLYFVKSRRAARQRAATTDDERSARV
ncbi:DUF6676 family protein [Nocardia transvalensis]|uniref:Rv1476 family membrane protein n=1 Tax=Nocardia transvalensis TaxID=37333 RepID=UPI00189596F9|nr:DUF6676 family protein [Nocardia transvalensis]MBF6331218.1 hypothetical protein [Nocardia transvalensis]